MPYLPEELVTPEQHSYLNLISELQAFRREWRTEMANLNESIDRLFTDVSTQLQQVRDGLVATIDSLTSSNAELTTENADLKSQLEANVADVDAAIVKLDAKSTELEADDPAPADPTA